MRKHAFTIVELIVVITILAILGTIAFISLNNFSASARDAKRLSDVRSLYTKLTLENIKGTKYEDLIDVKSTTNTLKINGEARVVAQGVVNFGAIKENRDNFLDPITNSDYPVAFHEAGLIASLSTEARDSSVIEIATINEEKNKAVVVGNYFPSQVGDTPGLIMDEEGNIIINEGEELTTTINSCIEKGQVITTTNTKYINTSETGGGTCDTDDIIVCSGEGTGYQLSACNVGAIYAGAWSGCTATNTTSTDNPNCAPERQGYHFQWGNNYPFSLLEVPIMSTVQVPAEKGYSSPTFITINPWNTPETEEITNDLWGGTTGTDETKRGPCAVGYHIPSSTEWLGMYTALGELVGTDLGTTLKLPITNARRDNTNIFDTSPSGDYWTSTLDKNLMTFPINSKMVITNFPRSYGFSIRCFKNL